MEEGKGFEPLIPCGIPHFECGAFDHSATLPHDVRTLVFFSFRVNFLYQEWYQHDEPEQHGQVVLEVGYVH